MDLLRRDQESHKCYQNPASPIQRLCIPTVRETPNSGTLLVVNQQTTKEELKAWEELVGFIFGEKNAAGVVDVWDISLVGDFHLNSVLKPH